MKREIYLSGASKCLGDQGKYWRDIAERNLKDNGFDVFNPMNHYDYIDLTPETDKACMKLFLNRLDDCNIMLVNLSHTNYSCGTSVEIGFAVAQHIPIIGFNNNHAYNWSQEACDVILDNLQDAIDYIVTHY